MPTWSWVTGTESEHNLLPPFFFSAVSPLRLLFPSKSFVQGRWCLSKDKFSSRKPPCCHLHFCLCLRMEDSKWSCSSHEHFMDLIFSVSSNEELSQCLTGELWRCILYNCFSVSCSVDNDREDSPKPDELSWKPPELWEANILTAPAHISPPKSFSSATEPGWSVTSKDSCQWFMAGTWVSQDFPELLGVRRVQSVDMCTCWLAPCVLLAPACFHPVPLGRFSRLTHFRVHKPLRDLRGWQGMIYSCHALSAGEQKTIHPPHKSTLSLFCNSYDCVRQVSYIFIFKCLDCSAVTKLHYCLAIF